MIRIAITQAAFDAIARTMPFGSVNFEAGVDDTGERYIWLPRAASTGCARCAPLARASVTLFCGWRQRRASPRNRACQGCRHRRAVGVSSRRSGRAPYTNEQNVQT
jgi:hypothetical protein